MTAELVIVARNSAQLRDLLIFHRRLEHHAVGELIDHAALDLLPRRLALWIMVAAVLLQLRTPLGELALRDEDIRRALVEIDAHPVAGLQQRQSAARRCL